MSTNSTNHTLIIAFDVIVLLGVLLFTGTLLPAIFAKGVRRSITWYSTMTSWLVYSLTYGLIVGRQEGPYPARGLCLFQTLLIYSVPVLVATSMLCYYIEFYLIITGLKSGDPSRRPPTARIIWLTIIPWLVFMAMIAEVLVLIYTGDRLHLVERTDNNFYCHLNDNKPSLVTAGVICVSMAILIPLEVWTGSVMYRNWDVFRRLSRVDRQIYLTVYLRLILCTVAAIIAFALSTLAFAFPYPDQTSIVYPTLPIFIAVAFGLQKDILRAWLFWLPEKPYSSLIFQQGNGYTNHAIMTTNIYTSFGAAIPTELQNQIQTGTETETDTQLREHGKPTDSAITTTSIFSSHSPSPSGTTAVTLPPESPCSASSMALKQDASFQTMSKIQEEEVTARTTR